MSGGLQDRIKAAIFDELDRQNENDEIGGHGYWSSEWGTLDGEPDWGAVAAAVLAALNLTEETERVQCDRPLDECTWSYGCGHDGLQSRHVTPWVAVLSQEGEQR